MPWPFQRFFWYDLPLVHISHCESSEITMRRTGRSISLSHMSTQQARALTSILPRTLSRWTPATPTARRLTRSPRSAAGAAVAGPRLQGEPRGAALCPLMLGSLSGTLAWLACGALRGGPGSTEADEKDSARRGSGEDGACRLLGNYALPTSKDASGSIGPVPAQLCKACKEDTAPVACFGHRFL